MRFIDFKQYLTSFITITLKDGTIHSGFVSNPEMFSNLENDAVLIPDVRLMNGLMTDIVHFEDIDFVELADREDTLSLKMILSDKEEVINNDPEESDFEKMMDSLKRLVVQGKEDRPHVTKAVLSSRPAIETDTLFRQSLTITDKGEITLISNHEPYNPKKISIAEEDANEILMLLYDIDAYEANSYRGGSFKLVLSLEDYENIRIYGPLNGKASANGITLTPYLKKRIPLDSLVLFG